MGTLLKTQLAKPGADIQQIEEKQGALEEKKRNEEVEL
jgi:hypothetical protein